MPYALQAGEHLASGLRRVAAEQADKAMALLRTGIAEPDGPVDDAVEDPWDEGVHEARKAGKKIRAVARQCRDALGEGYHHVNAQFRDATRLLADVRDAWAMLETADLLVEPDRAGALGATTHAALRSALSARYRRLRAQARQEGLVEQSLEALAKAATDIDDWPLPDDLRAEDLRPSIERVYRRGRDGWRRARDGAARGRTGPVMTEQWHDWRKRAKYLRYQAELLSPSNPAVLTAMEEELHRLTDAIGTDHDLAVLTETVREEKLVDPEVARSVAAAAQTLREAHRSQALEIAPGLYCEVPEVFADRLTAYAARTSSPAVSRDEPSARVAPQTREPRRPASLDRVGAALLALAVGVLLISFVRRRRQE